MKSVKWVLDNYDNLKTLMEDRFGKRFASFLSEEQMKQIGLELKDEYKGKHIPKVWNEENVLAQLKEDVAFGIEKALDHRGISASLMFDVCRAWCIVLENGLENTDYGWYGDKLFKALDQKYNFGLIKEDTFSKAFYEEW